MAPEGNTDSNTGQLNNVLSIGNKAFNVTLTDKHISWSYKQKHPFSDKEKKTWKCKHQVPIEEVVAVEYIEKDINTHHDAGDIEMVSINASSFRLHVVKRLPKHVWKMKSIEFQCGNSAQCALWVDSIRHQLEKFKFRPKSLLVFINPFGGKKKAQKIFDEKVAPIFDLASIRSHIIKTERAGHAKDHLQSHDLSRYDGIVCVGGDGMFAELLNGILVFHNTRVGVDVDDEDATLRQPDIRIGVIPAGSTDTVSYCTNGINDVMTAALHIIVGDSMAIDVCSVRQGSSGKLIKFGVSMLGYGFYGDVLRDSERLRWMGPMRYNVSGMRTFIKNRSYNATVTYIPAVAIQEDHHPGVGGSKCYYQCNICQSASLYDLNGSLMLDRYSVAATDTLSVQASNTASGEADTDRVSFMVDSSLMESESDLSIYNRPVSSLSRVPPENWKTVTGNFIGINALTISCRCATVPEGVSPTCHLGDGSADLVLVYDASRIDYFRHLYRMKAKDSSQFNFGFVNVIRTKAFRVSVTTNNMPTSSTQASSSFHRLENEERVPNQILPEMSCWNCDGEIIDEPNINVRVHCQLVKIFSRGIEHPDTPISPCLSCTAMI